MNPTTLATPEAEPTQAPVERRSRFGFRRQGAPVMQTEVIVEQCEDTCEEAFLFGIEDQLEQYEDLWQNHSNVIAEFATDEQNAELLAEVIDENRDNPRIKRQHGKSRDIGLEQFTSIYVLAGRDAAQLKTGRIATIRQAVKNPDATFEDYETRKRVIGKQKGIFSNLKVTPQAEKLERVFLGFQHHVEHTYRPIAKLEDDMTKRVAEQITSPDTALQFVEAVIGNRASEVAMERNFSSLFLNQYVSEGENSLLHNCLAALGESGAVFTDEFIQAKLDEHDGDNLFAFFDQTLQAAGQGAIKQHMKQRVSEWPKFLSSEYGSFAQTKLAALRIGIQKALDSAVKKGRLHTDLDTFEEAVDRLYLRLYNRLEDKRFIKPSNRQKPSLRFRPNPTEVLSQAKYDVEQDKKPREVQSLVRTQDGYITKDAADIETLIADSLGSKHNGNKAFTSELKQAIERLQLEPFGNRGIRSIQKRDGLQISVNGKLLRLYRANPSRMTGISTSRQSKELRIVFTADKDSLNILRIFTQHSDYEQFIDNL